MQKQLKKPVPMGLTSYPTSDALETWVDQTIQTEIVRGRMLQDHKSLLSERTNHTAVVIKSPRLAGENFNRRSLIPRWNGKRGRGKSPLAKNVRMSTSESRDSREQSCSSYKSPRLTRPACSMRISELATPTKRQCIASWRANSKVLPAIMVDRLKQRVLDQEPIVKVSDAVNCMRNRRLPPDNRSNFEITPTKRPSRKINKEAMRRRIQAKYKTLSEVFGMKIAQLLMKPVAITLNSQLQNLSNVISEEINKIIKDTKMFKTDKATNMRMVQEISEKVTIWIAKILDDSSEKLLEEDLKARATPGGELITLIQIITYKETDLEEQEGPVLDILDDMVDAILHKCVRVPSENVSPEYLSVSSGDADKDGSYDTDRQTADDEASQGDVITVDEEANDYTIETDIINQLNVVIDNIIHEETLDTPIKESDDRSKYQQDNTENSDFEAKPDNKPEYDNKPESDIKLEPAIKAETERNPELPDIAAESDLKPEPDNNVESDINPEPKSEAESDTKPEPVIDVLYSNDTPLDIAGEYNDDDHTTNVDISDTPELNYMRLPSADEVTELPIMQNQDKGDENLGDSILLEPEENNLIDTNEEQTSNVSGAIELITGELSEEKSKKVQFSNENLDPMNEKEQVNPFIRGILQFEDEHQLENVTDFEKLHIDFAPPNDELLSDADESWPEKIPVTKPSASVTRSITSMGRLLESDEISTTAFEDSTENLPLKTVLEKKYEGSDEEDDLHKTIKLVEDMKGNNRCETPDMAGLQNISEDVPNTIEIEKRILHEPLTQFDTENVNVIPLSELAQGVSVTSVSKNESVILIGDEELQGLPEPEPIVTQSKYQKCDSTISVEELDISKCDQAKTATHTAATKNQIDQGRSSTEDYTLRKFDYRVHPKTAPSWIRRGQGEPNGGPCSCRPFHYSVTNKIKERELEIRKWCRDLDYILKNLDEWKNWLNYISKYITELKRKAGKIAGSRQARPPPGTGEDATWRALNKRANEGLEVRRQDEAVKFQIPPAPVKYCVSCGRRKPNQLKRRHHRSNSRNNTESLCKRHHKREI